MSWFRRQTGMLRQIWVWFLVLLILNQFALLTCVYVLLVKPAADSFSVVAMGLVDATLQQQVGPRAGLGILQDHWVSRDNIIVQRGMPANLEPVPPFPGLRTVERLVRERWGNKIEVGFSQSPERILWLHYPEGDSFSVGVPMDQRMLALVFVLFAGLLILVLSIVAAWALAVRLTRPLNRLSDVAKKLGRGEQVGEITPEQRAPPEVVQLTAALNQMQREISEMLRERERFLTGITHDLRTPLSRIRVALELGHDQDSELTEGLREDIEEMRVILEQFIELSRLDTEQSEGSISGDLNSVVLAIADKYQRAGEVLAICLGEIAAISYKPVALNRLLYNLIDNALRYGQGTVTVVTGRNVVGAWLTVSNRESGATKHVARGSALVAALAWASNGQQSGLGLAIVRRLAEVHEATLTVDRDTEGVRTVRIQFAEFCNSL